MCHISCPSTMSDSPHSIELSKRFIRPRLSFWLLDSSFRHDEGRSSGNTFKGGGERGGRHVGRPRRNFCFFFFFTLFQDTLAIVLSTNSLLRYMETSGRHSWLRQRQVFRTVQTGDRQKVQVLHPGRSGISFRSKVELWEQFQHLAGFSPKRARVS